MTSLGIVVPAFRPDAERLASYLRDLDAELGPETIRVELDAPDEGIERTLSALDVPPLEVNAVAHRRGKGAAITAGFEALSTERLAFADADGSTAAAELARVVGALDRSDVAAGSRRHPDSTVVGHRTLVRRLLGDGFAWVARRALDSSLYDYQCGAKALTADTWRTVRPHLYEGGFAWDIELIAVASAVDRRIVEVPVRWEDHPDSTVSTVDTTLRLARALVTSRHRARLLRENRLHQLVASRRRPGPALIERLAAADAADPTEAD